MVYITNNLPTYVPMCVLFLPQNTYLHTLELKSPLKPCLCFLEQWVYVCTNIKVVWYLRAYRCDRIITVHMAAIAALSLSIFFLSLFLLYPRSFSNQTLSFCIYYILYLSLSLSRASFPTSTLLHNSALLLRFISYYRKLIRH